jgi:hypothetical protein
MSEFRPSYDEVVTLDAAIAPKIETSTPDFSDPVLKRWLVVTPGIGLSEGKRLGQRWMGGPPAFLDTPVIRQDVQWQEAAVGGPDAATADRP